jgi:two-component system LytT family sensor kinase
MASTLTRQNWFINFLIEDRYRFYRHLLIWVYLIFTEFHDADAQRQYSGNYDLYRYIGRISLFLVAVYINMYILVPRLLFRDRYFAYFMAIISMTAVAYLLPTTIYQHFFEAYQIPDSPKRLSFFAEVVPNINVLGVAVFSSTSIKLFQRWKLDSTRMSDLEKTTLEIELRELKNQINPHFLFNMLNNVNVLIQKDAQKASAVVVKLSDFLRYQLYETSGGSVSLNSEIKFLEDFLALEKIRREDFTFTILIRKGTDSADQDLPPGLFLTFAENAVKYSADPDAPSSVQLDFGLFNNKLEFICVNTKPEIVFSAKSGGLGLTNIERRLNLLYGEEYSLKIEDAAGLYKVILKIPL